MLGPILRNATLMVGALVGGMFLLGEFSAVKGPSAGTPRDAAPGAAPAAAERRSDGYGETMVIAPGRGGHYHVTAAINGREIAMLVDTGATMVALSRRDAERIGIMAHQLDYSGRVQTANGIARVARVTLDELALGDISVRDVHAAVIDAPLGTSLLGMSFLQRLRGFSVENGKLILRQ